MESSRGEVGPGRAFASVAVPVVLALLMVSTPVGITLSGIRS